LDPSVKAICTTTNDNEELYKVIYGEKWAPAISHPPPNGSTIFQKNNWILPFWLYEHLQMTMNYLTKFQVSQIGHLKKEMSTSYFTPSTPLGSTITHNWILLSRHYTHLQMKMTLYKSFQSPLHYLQSLKCSTLPNERWTNAERTVNER
jgi:hypothetical protein